ncbi:hypothetical protein Gasu2_32110 [Galdieria sulphuraria]|uniref:Zinc finger (C3HC4-type RING finger) family protein n=1 Tax=Galdieria sulphuraria TaxID=130081 RepID=M2WZA1_GALSU|nr:zinc finger (C3HC4-type RING finger) family protein [Galdieria sulphuraria]EME29400.1 zinc finger (C3HC4-type RING finger) family protein [Galdieria sulphuraria]GJD08934.1 hypothetical protein Gasu2_32110 [Galdieria sulphuraria]|eukprot:XP_005705920.1 zinc finger (C3HC4-type RING finger) family protein [Galdieria sulphuraria]
MEIAVIITLSIYLFIMFSICSASVLLKRGRRGLILENRFPPPSRQGAYNSLGMPSTTVFGFLPSHSSKLDEVAPELAYGDKHSFYKVRPQLRELFKYCKGVAPTQDASVCKYADIENAISLSTTSCCSTSPEETKLHLEEEEVIVEAQKKPSQRMVENNGRNILERTLFAVYLKGKDEEAEWLFDQILRDHNICVICLDDFEVNCSIRMLHCAHFFHSNCLRQWLSKSTQCPLCKDSVYLLQNVEETNRAIPYRIDNNSSQ